MMLGVLGEALTPARRYLVDYVRFKNLWSRFEKTYQKKQKLLTPQI